jgi:hypothetical protein
MMNRIAMFGAAAVVGMAGLANAAQISFSDTFNMDLSPGADTATVSQFNPALGTLNYILIELDATVGAGITGENDSAIAGNMGVSLTGLVNLTGPSAASATAGIAQNAGPVAVTATDGVPDSGADFNDFGLISGSDTDSSILVVGFVPYTGLGNVVFNLDGSGGFAINGVTNSTLKITDFAADGTVKITYDYDAIPEPASLGLFAIGGLMMIRRRRDR